MNSTNAIRCPRCGSGIVEHENQPCYCEECISAHPERKYGCQLTTEDIARSLVEDARMEVQPGCPHHDISGEYPQGAEDVEPCTCPVPREYHERALAEIGRLRALLVADPTSAEVDAAADALLNTGHHGFDCRPEVSIDMAARAALIAARKVLA